MVWLTADRRRQLTMPISPMKLQPTGMQNDEPTAFFADDWEPTLDIEAGWSEDEHGEHDSQEIIDKPSTKRYTNSVSHSGKILNDRLTISCIGCSVTRVDGI